MTRTAHATCPLCEATCGITVELEGERVASVRGDDADPFSRGYICPKAAALPDIQDDPDRLRAPLRRRGRDWEEVSWDDALAEAASRLDEVQRRHGRDAVAFYLGNPGAHSYGGLLYGLMFWRLVGSKKLFSSNSVDALPRLLASYLVYGNQAVLPVPDLERTRFLLVLGANPVVSNGSVMTAPDVKARLKALRARGGWLVVVDPRRTETAELADAHHFIRPGTDALLLLGMLHTLFAEGLTAPGHLEELVEGLDTLAGLARRFAPERVADRVGMPAATIRQLARDFARAESAACYGRMGTCVQEFGAVTSWLIDALNIVTGNLDRPGGAMFPTPAVDLAGLAARIGQAGAYDRYRSRGAGLPEFNGELPAVELAAEIELPGAGQVRALVTNAGNPVLSIPNGRRLDRALAQLDYMVSIDIYLNETTRHADLILPPAFGLEHDHYPILFHALSVRNFAKYSPAVVAPPPGVRPDWRIFLGLARGLLRARGGVQALAAGPFEALLGRLGPTGMLAGLLRIGPYGKLLGQGLTLAQLEAAPHGVDLGPLEPRLPGVLATPGRRIRLAPDPLVADLGRLDASLGAAAGLVLIGRRELRSNNSWMHNVERLVKGPERCTLRMHPEDAARRGLADARRVRLSSRVGAVEVDLELTAEMMPGVVSLPHGWGHDREGTRLAVAARHAGASANDVLDDALVDPVSGAGRLSGVPVEVERVG